MSDAAVAIAEAAPDDAGAAAPKSKRSLMIIVVAGVLVLGGLGAAGMWLVPKWLGGGAKAAHVEAPVKATVPLGPVVVNLTGETRRYLRVGLSLGLPDAKDGKEIEHHQAQLLDLLISVLSVAEVDVLTSDEGKAKLKEE